MPQSIVRRMPAGRKARWPARWDWRWPDRAATPTHVVDDPFLNAEATSQAVPDDIGRALDLYAAACVIEAAAYAALALVV